MTTYWAPLLHIYQPPTQELHVLKNINEECYIPLFDMINKHENAKFCLNISGILIELLYEHGMGNTVDLLKNLVAENKIEIMGTAKFHPILPLLPKKETYRQIRMNEEINRREFGNIWERNGFFPPEMAISSKVAKIVREFGYKWVIMSGIACPIDWPYDKIYTSPNGLQLFFRDDILSNKISFKKITAKEFINELSIFYKFQEGNNNSDTYVITAMDGETFGHHIKNYEKTFLGKSLELINDFEIDPKAKSKQDDITIEFISNLDQHFPIASKKIIPIESSWSTTSRDLKCEVPYPLWSHPDNNIHKYYWKIMKSLNKLMRLADNLDLTQNWDVENYYNTARYFYDRGLHSCPPWWSNPLRGAWSPNLIYNGVELLMRAALNAQLALVNAGVSDGDGYFDSISYYHGLLLMELYSTTKKNNNQ
ncbi:MAG: hypothetical protein GF317_10955 [Candidatus Lokiarchaeota archaeon]|nr:hypothetical protein [Candidatus Lokiarchaeota archaeon]MBD3200181.1 hypothetical protein [Candidatus Lokiarchaeota archaeon]